ncbi:MAG: NAD(P)/FAD-dependent oxidoreductase [Gammaproteobacteria bacterium]|nr:MAG: NAD(P)/FAD-dependent oxidoreductase [Gammaproteobacteria bacterium]
MSLPSHVDVLVIGAGPSGAIASALLVKKGYSVLVLEKEQFPRFSIGESLLPQCMMYIEEAGMLDAISAGGFQFKNGAAFYHDGKHTQFNFTEKFSPGPGTTFQVQRARFDKILADEAARQGADIRYRHEITAVDVTKAQPSVTCRTPEGDSVTVTAKFLLDASGFGRVLPRLLDLESPSDFPVRQSCFTHVKDNMPAGEFDRNKILVSIHPEHRDVWYWTIPFANGVCSLGVVAKREFFNGYTENLDERLMTIVGEEPRLAKLLANAEILQPARQITGYSANVKSLYGNGYALLGNAGEFLDPVFSSGVTIAMKSASMAAALLDRQLQGETVDWETEYAKPLKKGVDAFRTFVTAWYDQRFQDVIFHHTQLDTVKAMICSILAGYAWDEDNPYVRDSERRLNVLAKICATDAPA